MNCKDATHLMSQQLDRPLHLKERLSLSLHLAICPGCRNFGQQIQFIHQACQALKSQPAQDGAD